MEVHLNNLKNLCRVCGEVIQLDPRYKNAKYVTDYASELLNCCNIVVGEEDCNIYPKKFCKACHHNFYKMRREGKTKTIQPAYFEAHSDKCSLCFTATSTQKFTPKPLHAKELDKFMEDLNFVKIDVSEKAFRYYVKEQPIHVSIYVYENLSWKCEVLRQFQLPLLESGLPINLNEGNILLLKDFFNSRIPCEGLAGFDDVLQEKLEIRSPFSQSEICVETEDHQILQQKERYTIFRKENCELFFNPSNQRKSCDTCWSFAKSNLWRARSRLPSDEEPVKKKQRTSDSSNCNFRFLSREELIERLTNTAKVKKEAMNRASYLSKRINEDLKRVGVEIDKELDEFCRKIITKKENDDPFPEDSPQSLLWQQQKQQVMSKGGGRGMRWHPLIIRWCLSIYNLSPAAYKQMSSKRLNFMKLPCVETLRKYINYTKPSTGFNPDVIKVLIQDSNLANLKEFQKQVALSFDEMKIKSDLVYQRSTGKMVGFTELGNINQEFEEYQKSMEDPDDDFSKKDFATYVNVYMVRGIFTDLQQAFGYYATRGISGHQLYPCTMEAVRVLTAIGFHVRSMTSDGASSNRKFFDIIHDGDHIHKSVNPFEHSKHLYAFSDVPHLVKTTCNGFENSHWNKKTRTLHLDKQDISWKHVLELYEEDLGINYDGSVNRCALGIRKTHKLREEHVKKTPRSRMTVKLAAQVMSQTTANALKSQNRNDTKSTIKFIEKFDEAFDCLNVSKINKGKFGKPNLKEYRSSNDKRFETLQNDFLGKFLGGWKKQVDEMIGMKAEQKNRLLLSKETLFGWKMSVTSFVELAKELLPEKAGPLYLYSERFSQDPLEEYFSLQRAKGGANENPDAAAMGRQFVAISSMKSNLQSQFAGINALGRDRDTVTKFDIKDKTKLPTKK